MSLRQPTSRPSARRRPFVVATGVRTVEGIVLLTRPRPLLSTISGRPVDEKVAIFARALGARQLIQAAILWRWNTPSVLRAGAAVDALHAASVLTLVKSRHRRLAILNVVSASTWALVGVRLARQRD